jgi:exosortase
MTRLPGHPLNPSTRPAPPWQPAAVVGALAGGLLWCYWQTLVTMADRWARDPQYSHGFLVPVFAAAVLWARRDKLAGVTWQPDPFGLPLMVGGLGLRWCAVRIDFEALDAASLLPTLAGVVLLVGGRGFLRWAWPAIAFLAFMMPLPFFIEISLAHPLRRLATILSTYALQTFGCPATAEGNIILIGDIRLGVAEACSGLGMLMTFFALSTALALIVQAPVADRLVLVISAIPIAVFANVARITATGLAYDAWGQDSEAARVLMHDLAGWLMIGLTLVLLWLETRYLARLWIDVPDDRPLPLSLTGTVLPSTDLKRT